MEEVSTILNKFKEISKLNKLNGLTKKIYQIISSLILLKSSSQINYIEELKDLTENLKIKKLVLSGDLIKDKESKIQVNQLRQRGIKIDIVGPVI
jgi:hypothetical protein